MAPGVEISDLNWIAIGLAILTNIILGFLWYAPKTPTGRVWMRQTNMDPDRKPTSRELSRAMVLMVLGAFFMMFVFQHTFVAYRDAYRLDGSHLDDGITYLDGVMGAFFTWIGFFVPVLWGVVAWEGKSWALFFVNAGYYFVALLAAGLIYAGMM